MDEHDKARVISNVMKVFCDLRLLQVFKRVLKEVDECSSQDNSCSIGEVFVKGRDKDDAPVPKCLPIKKTMCGILRKGTDLDRPGKETALNRTVGDVFSAMGSCSPRREITRMMSMIWKRGSGWPSSAMSDTRLGSIRTIVGHCSTLLLYVGDRTSHHVVDQAQSLYTAVRSRLQARASTTSCSILDSLERMPGPWQETHENEQLFPG